MLDVFHRSDAIKWFVGRIWIAPHISCFSFYILIFIMPLECEYLYASIRQNNDIFKQQQQQRQRNSSMQLNNQFLEFSCTATIASQFVDDFMAHIYLCKRIHSVDCVREIFQFSMNDNACHHGKRLRNTHANTHRHRCTHMMPISML